MTTNDESPWKTLEARVAKNQATPPYVYETDVLRAVKVAGAIDRVLLVRGAPGTGKSTLARNIASALGWNYLEHVVTSRTQARDLLWTFDHVERLNDAYASAVAQSNRVGDKKHYVEPGPLWRALDPTSADAVRKAPGEQVEPRPGAVVLIDEIDKADPDLPNDLLVPLDARSFPVDPLGQTIKATRQVFLVVSTNDERDLPQAFLRRCVIVTLKRPTDPTRLRAISQAHFGNAVDAVTDAVIDLYLKLGERASGSDARPPGTAEFLDALRACKELGIDSPTHPEFALGMRSALWKHADT